MPRQPKDPGRPTTDTGSEAKTRVRISNDHAEKLQELIASHTFLTNNTQAVAYILDKFFEQQETADSPKMPSPIYEDSGGSEDLLSAFLAA